MGQAINAGDALFAAAHLPLYRLASPGVTAELKLRLLEAFDRMTIAIVEGQTQDLAFEARPDVAPGEYLEMIAGKTAAIVRFAAWAGALLGRPMKSRHHGGPSLVSLSVSVFKFATICLVSGVRRKRPAKHPPTTCVAASSPCQS